MSKYVLFNQEVVLSDSAERFFDVQHSAWRAIENAKNELTTWYASQSNIKTVLEQYCKKASSLVVKHAVQPLFDQLVGLEIYDVSKSSYEEQCYDCSESEDAFNEIAELYNDIVEEQEAAIAYRADRKDARSRVVGGGFGVSGALKGMATAGAMNAISGAGHSIVNAIGNAGSALAASSAKNALYKNEQTLSTLISGVTNDILAVFNAHISLINEKKEKYISGSFDTDKASALFENAMKVADKKQSLLVDSFRNCPWNSDLLKYIFIEFPQERQNVWGIANRFHVNLNETVESVFENIYSGSARTSEDKAQAAKKEIKTLMEDLGITRSATFDTLEQDCVTRLLLCYDRASDMERSKIMDSIINYDATDANKANVIHKRGVWELAKKYKVSFSADEIEDILSKYYSGKAKSSESDALIAKQYISTIMHELGISSSKCFDQLESDCIARLCPEYNSADEATCNEMISKISSYDALDKNKKPYLDKLQRRIEEIWSAEDGEIFDNVYMNTNILDSAQVQKSIEFIKSKGRTASAQRYLAALNTCSKDNLDKARLHNTVFSKCCSYIGIGLVALGIVLLIADLGIVLGLAVGGIGGTLIAYTNKLKNIWNTLTLSGSLIHPMLEKAEAEKGHVESAATEREGKE